MCYGSSRSCQTSRGPSEIEMPSSQSSVNTVPKSHLADLSARHGLPRPTEAFFDAQDGTRLRYAHWQSEGRPKRGRLLFLHGRTEFIEKAIETYGTLVRSGLDLWTLDWRGQGLSERSLSDPHRGHVTDYQHFLDDLDRFVRDIAGLPDSPGKTFMLAHSMGGHIGLRYLHDHPGIIDAAVLLAPMIDLPVNKAPIRCLNRVIIRVGFGNSYALGTGPFKPVFVNPADPMDNGTIDDYRALVSRYEELSRDPAMRAEVEGYVRDNQALALGGPTSAWLGATFRSINLILAPGYAEPIETPVLLIGAGRDRVVVMSQQRRMATRLPNGDFQVIEQGGHELLMEGPDIRREVLEAFSRWTGVAIERTADQSQSA